MNLANTIQCQKILSNQPQVLNQLQQTRASVSLLIFISKVHIVRIVSFISNKEQKWNTVEIGNHPEE